MRSARRVVSRSWIVAFLKLDPRELAMVSMSPNCPRPVNAGFSGGEKKRNEILQMALLEPSSAIPTRPTRVSISTP